MAFTRQPTSSTTRALLSGAVLIVTLLIASSASAESPVSGNFARKFGPYYPQIDEAFSGSNQPFQDSFGADKRILAQLEVEYYVWQGFGSLGVGVQSGYTNFSGTSEITDAGGSGNGGSDNGGSNGDSGSDDELSLSEETKFQLFPLGATVSYRFDYLLEEFSIPLAFKVESGIDFYLWRVRDGSGNLARAGSNNAKAAGVVPGYHLSGRAELALDSLDPSSSAVFDVTWGINHTYLFAEYTFSQIDRFGGEGFRLGDSTWKIGLAFEY